MFEDFPDVLTVRDVCVLLRIERKAVYSLLRSGKIQNRKIGRIYRIPKEAVVRYLHEK